LPVSEPGAIRILAPASSANLGPGFDCLAVALELRNEVEIRRTGGEAPVLHVDGEGEEEHVAFDEHLFVRAFRHGGGDPAGLEFRLRNRVPFARGLGSSAATIAAGLVAAEALGEASERDLLGPAFELEGHPDNVAAALNGGLTLAWTGAGGPRAVGFGPPDVTFVLVVPDEPLSTAEARAALPATVPHADAVHTAARAALLIAALAGGHDELLSEALDDRLHEPYRAPLVPLLANVREQLAGRAYGATLSGAGPSVLVWCPAGAEGEIASSLQLSGARAMPVQPAQHGTYVEAIG
jgi:homoserine kinase